jgi:hypothetical protein
VVHRIQEPDNFYGDNELTFGLGRCVSTQSMGSLMCSTLQPYATGVNLMIVWSGTYRYGSSSGRSKYTFIQQVGQKLIWLWKQVAYFSILIPHSDHSLQILCIVFCFVIMETSELEVLPEMKYNLGIENHGFWNAACMCICLHVYIFWKHPY